jgi:hypothetical protein
MIYYESTGIVVSWDDALQSAAVEFRDFVDGDELRAAALSVVKLLEARRAHKLLTDSRAMKAVTQDDQQWLDTVWQKKVRAAGLTHNAVVVPKSTVGQMSLTAVVKKIPAGSIEFAYFSSLDEAKKWLRSK